jgi:hypothetical protein
LARMYFLAPVSASLARSISASIGSAILTSRRARAFLVKAFSERVSGAALLREVVFDEPYNRLGD